MKKHKSIREEFIWTTQEGVEWLLKDMKDSHIRNCIKFLKRKKNVPFDSYFQENIQLFETELLYRRSQKIKKFLNAKKNLKDIC